MQSTISYLPRYANLVYDTCNINEYFRQFSDWVEIIYK